MIPLYIIEEHHEAFYIWNMATQAGHLPPFGNTLLHVDHHPDFECGLMGADLDVLFRGLEEIREFTYNNLGIAEFIIPAIYQGIFNDVVILKDFSPILPKPENKTVRPLGSGGLAVEPVTALSRLALKRPEAKHRLFTYRQGGLGDFSTPQALALDIDLDYFCWDDSLSTVAHKRLEITEAAYREFTENPYHPFRVFPISVVSAIEESGRYYVCYTCLPKPEPLPTWERVLKRVELFLGWLDRVKISPCMISVCRSRYSGYTPGYVWRDLEEILLARLKEVFDYELANSADAAKP